jgi:diguanylate cyclase
VLATVRGYGEVRVRAANARAARLERVVAEQTARLTTTVVELQRTQDDLESANQRLLDLSTRDQLTGLANRRLFDERLAEDWSRARRQGTPLALILADLDHFKRLNDSLGHPAGDACLREVARSFRDTLRRSLDLVARYGGEEFALLLPDTALEAALEVAEELRHGVESLGIAADGEGATRVTASFGVAVVQPGEDNQPQTLIEAADRALYRAKRGGRNQVVGDSI